MIDESSFDAVLANLFGHERVGRRVPLARFTTFRVGGPADWLVEPTTADETLAVLRLAHAAGVPVAVVGGGSNLLVSDAGFRGLVVRPRAASVTAVEAGARADAGVTINGLVRWTIGHALGGLEAWAGTPGTVGGAIYGNAHFGGRLIGELVERVVVATPDGRTCELPASAMEFGYDRSRVQRTREVLLSATFHLTPGADPARLRAVARESLALRKRTQPLDHASAGCIFQNPAADALVPDGIPRSAGALIDRAGLKGHRVGAARVSEVHANFIVNEGGASAADIDRLIAMCRDAVHERFGVILHEEIVRLGQFGVRGIRL